MSRIRALSISFLPFLLAACGGEAPPPGPPPREPIAIRYVQQSELPIHASPDPSSEVIATFLVGEPVSVLAEKGEWT
ncbi:MAG: SH3 domain-containing protein, partial [Thermoanaerobaculia bacterium]